MLQAFNGELDRRLANLPLSPEIRRPIDEQRTRLAGLEIPPHIDPGLRQSLKAVVDESFVAGYRRVMIVSLVLALLSAVSAWLLIDGKTNKG